MRKVVILGAGISGLIVAEKLVTNNYKVVVFEKESILGGLASSFKIKDKWIPKTYHHFLPNEKIMLDLVSELNFEKNLLWNDSSICFWFDKKGYGLTKPQDILFFKPFSWKLRIKIMRLGIISFLKKNWSNLKGKDAESWVRKISGRQVTDKLFKPLARIKFGELSSVSAAWFGERLHEAAINRERYAYLNCGLQKFIDAIGEDVRKKGGEIYLNAIVTKIERNKVYTKINNKEKVFEADKIVSSLPPSVLAKIADIPKKEKKKLERVKYKPMICMVASSKNLITLHYWNVFIKPLLRFGGFFHHTALYPQGGIDGEYLYYFFTYLDEGDSLYKESVKEIEEIYLRDIKKICPNFEYSWTKVFKIKYSSPVYSMNYENTPIKLSDKIYLTGVYRMYPSTRTMNSAARSGLETANFVLNER